MSTRLFVFGLCLAIAACVGLFLYVLLNLTKAMPT